MVSTAPTCLHLKIDFMTYTDRASRRTTITKHSFVLDFNNKLKLFEKNKYKNTRQNKVLPSNIAVSLNT